MRPVGAIIGVAANAARGLERIGLAHIVETACIPVQRLDYLNWRGRRLTYMPIQEVARDLGTRTFIALRSDVQLGMYDSLPDGMVRLGSTFVGFEQDESGVTARFEDGREERGAALIGADGINSATRGQLLGDDPRYSGYGGWRGVAPMAPQPLEPGLAKQVLGRGKTFGAFGLTNDRVYWWASARMEAGRGDSAAGRKADVRETFRGAPELVGAIVDATPEEAILRNDIYDRPPVERWGEGRVTLIGDAGHAATPNTGEGGSQALLDGIVLGESLAGVPLSEKAAVSAALQSFEAEAIPRTADVVNRAKEIGTFIHLQNPAAALMRDLVFYRATPKRIWRKRAAVYLEAAR